MIRIEGTDWEILRILNNSNVFPIRSVDIAKQLGLSKATISKAMAVLESLGLIERGDKLITMNLTKQGKWYAEFYEKVKNGSKRCD